jgi:hypothetical protein
MGLLGKKQKVEEPIEEVKEVPVQEEAKVIGNIEEPIEEVSEEVKEEVKEDSEEQDLPMIITENQLINMKLDKILRLLSNE